MSSREVTDLVLDEVRSLRDRFIATPSAFPVVAAPASQSSPSYSKSRPVLREYSTRPSASKTSTSETRKRAWDESGAGGREGEKSKAPTAASSSTSFKAISPVLRYSLSNVTYRVNLEALSRVFSQYGRLIKLTRFPSHGSLAGYVQFENASAAQMAINKLQGRNIYHGCCRLHLSATDIPDLTIRADLDDGDHGKDFTAAAAKAIRHSPSSRAAHQDFSVESYSQSSQRRFGDVGREGGFQGDGRFGSLWPESGRGDADTSFGDVSLPFGGAPRAKTVLFITNLNESKVTAERLFMVFGVYCDVLKVKIFFREKSKAVLQAIDGYQADTARHYMDGVVLWGRSLSVTFASAKYQEVNIIAGADETWAKDFSFNSFQSHRFRGSFGHKHFQNLTVPIPTLYVSNMMKGTTEDRLKKFFEDSLKKAEDEEIGGKNEYKRGESEDDDDDDAEAPTSTSSSSKVVKVQLFPTNPTMAFVEMIDVDAAFEAIIRVHDRRLDPAAAKGKRLFVNFSKVHLDDFNKSGWRTLFRGE